MATRKLEVVIVGNSASLQKALGASATGLEAFGKKAQATGRNLTRHITAPIVGIGVVATKMAVDFQAAMEQVHTQAGASQKEVDRMSKSVLGLARSTEQGPVALAKALYELESVGLRGSRALKTLHAASELAAVGGADLQTATSAVASAMVAWQIPTNKATQTAATLNAIVGAGKMHMQDLVAAMGTKLPGVAAQLGISLQSVGGALAAFTDQGVGAETAATNLVTPLFKMAVVTAPKAVKALAGIGLGVHSLADDFRTGGISKAITDLHSHLQGLTKNQQTDVIANAFGGSRGSAPILQMLKVFNSATNSVQARQDLIGRNTKKFAGDVAAEHATAAHKIKVAWSSIQVALIKVGDALAPVVEKVAGVVGSLADKFSALSPHIQKIILIAVGVAAALGPVVYVVGVLAAAFAAIASPVGLAIAAIVGIGVAAHAMGVKFSDVKNVAKTAFEGIKSAVRDMAQWVVNALNNVRHALTDAVQWVTTAVNNVKTEVGSWKVLWFVVGTTVGAAVAVVKNALALLGPLVSTTMGVVGAVFRTGWHVVTALTSAAWNTIKGIVSGAAQVLKGIVQVITGIFSGNFGRMWTGIKNVFKGGVKAIGTVMLAVPKAVLGVFKNLPGDMLNIGKNIIQGLADGIKNEAGNLIHIIKTFVTDKIPGFVKKALAIFSPSRVMYDIGGNIVKGLAQGIVDGAGDITSAAQRGLVYPIDAAITALNNRKAVLQSTWDKIDAAAQRSSLVAAIGKAKTTTTLDASTHFGLTGGSSKSSVLATILAVGKKMGASPKQLLAATETGIVESGLKNLNYGDADSKGWRQERTSIYGNTHATSVVLSAQDFFKEAMGMDHKGLSAGELAANVQRPRADLRGKYAAVQAKALSLLGGSAPTRKQIVAATKKKGADQGQIRDAIKALRDFDEQAKRAKALAKIDIQVAHLDQLKAFKGAVADIRTGLKSMAQTAADAFRTMREGQISSAHDAASAALDVKATAVWNATHGANDQISASADAVELASLQKQDAAKQDAKTTEQLNADLQTAMASGDKKAQQDAQDAIDAYAQQKREQELTDNIAAAQQAADNAQTVALNGLDKEVADFQSALNAKLTSEADHLAQRKENYATFLKNVQTIAKQYGLSAADVIGASPDQEAAVTAGPGTGKPPAWLQAWAAIPGNNLSTLPAGTAAGSVLKTGAFWSAMNHRASGGPVRRGEPYIVGEQGQEVFVPDQNGRIVPNGKRHRMGRGNYIHYGDIKLGGGTDVDRYLNRVALKLA